MQQRIFSQRKPSTRTQRRNDESRALIVRVPAGGGTDGVDELLAAIEALLDQPVA